MLSSHCSFYRTAIVGQKTMISKRLFFIATLCIVNVSVYTINDSEYDTDGKTTLYNIFCIFRKY